MYLYRGYKYNKIIYGKVLIKGVFTYEKANSAFDSAAPEFVNKVLRTVWNTSGLHLNAVGKNYN